MFSTTDFFLACTILVYLTLLQAAILLCPQSSLCSAVLTAYLDTGTDSLTQGLSPSRASCILDLAFCFPTCTSLLLPCRICTLFRLFWFSSSPWHSQHNIQRYYKKSLLCSIQSFLTKALEKKVSGKRNYMIKYTTAQ